VSTIGFVVGGVGIAAGVVGLLMPTKELVVAPGMKAHLVLDPGSVGLAGSF
jgi:allophanate hydrolase subunit 1